MKSLASCDALTPRENWGLFFFKELFMGRINFRLLNPGDIVRLKMSTIAKYGFNNDFIKNSKRPFVVGKITDYNAFWLVPSYSHCTDFEQYKDKYYMKVFTRKGTEKYLKFRDMVVVEESDLLEYHVSNETICIDSGNIKEFNDKFKANHRILRKNRAYFEKYYQQPFKIEYKIITNKYLAVPYRWLERDFNIVNPARLFSSNEEFAKDNFADNLYDLYIRNLKYYLKDRNNYVNKRQKYLTNQFNITKLEIGYICLSENGFVSKTRPIQFSENYIDAALLSEEECLKIKSEVEIDVEPKNIQVPMLDDKTKRSVAKELIWLDNNIVSQKTYYDIYKSEPTKAEINAKIQEIESK